MMCLYTPLARSYPFRCRTSLPQIEYYQNFLKFLNSAVLLRISDHLGAIDFSVMCRNEDIDEGVMEVSRDQVQEAVASQTILPSFLCISLRLSFHS